MIATLKHLKETGDKIKLIEGIFSGTLSYIFNEFDVDQTFSDIVKVAKEKGYTEPDPRDDLAGMDVARKVMSCRSVDLHMIQNNSYYSTVQHRPDMLKTKYTFSMFIEQNKKIWL